jgi:hypothetical protein
MSAWGTIGQQWQRKSLIQREKVEPTTGFEPVTC